MAYCGQDDEGRQICVANMGMIDINSKEYNKNDVMRGMVATFFVSMFNEETQVHGTTYFEDAKDFSMKHQTYFGIEDSKRSTQLWQVGDTGISLALSCSSSSL